MDGSKVLKWAEKIIKEWKSLSNTDDTLIFCGEVEEQLKYLRVILDLFEAISGLHINRRKSHIYPINQVPDMELLAIILGGEVGNLPTVYLGMSLGAKSISKGIWDSVLEKCEKKLTRWKSQYLSLGGRLTLINVVLDALPTYMLSLFPIPPEVIQRLDKIKRSFLLQGNKEKSFSPSQVEGNHRKQETRGTWHQEFDHHSKALKLKWLWRYSQAPQTLWRESYRASTGKRTVGSQRRSILQMESIFGGLSEATAFSQKSHPRQSG
ncbi:hypothetical protein MTR67_008882 [Solanum verrucosum]|uniref:Uncharacterized protein n=1 Tax=Solanum verrucosum TaxID=315347 RepID=A0AAF0Q353_SOLVR|nr:hypothetical protein MTR67_008882 [Solanum verrucosum]